MDSPQARAAAKMGSAIVAGLTALTYLIFRVTAITKAISDKESAKELAATDEAKTAISHEITAIISGVEGWQTAGLLIAMVAIPLVFGFASYILYQKFYKLDEKKYEEICAELETKKNAEAQAE